MNKKSASELQKDFDTFLREYKRLGTILLACKSAGVARCRVYEWQKKYPDFAERMNQVKNETVEKLEDIVMRKAMSGEDGPLYFLLKSLRPEVYTERRHIRIESEQTVKVIVEITTALKQILPDKCPGCNTLLGFKEKLAKHLIELSRRMGEESVELHEQARQELHEEALEKQKRTRNA
jgi:hypothetical protein